MSTIRHAAGARRLLILLIASILALGLAACGDSAATVELNADEYDFELSATPTAETETVAFQNDGEDFHVLIFARINEGFTTEEAIKLEGEKGSAEIVAQAEAKPGETADAKVKGPLEPGDYAMLCPIGGPEGPHYELGQLEEFTIE